MSSRSGQTPANQPNKKKGKISSEGNATKPTATTLMLESMLETKRDIPKRQKPRKIAKAKQHPKNPRAVDSHSMWSRVASSSKTTRKANSLADLVGAKKPSLAKTVERVRKQKLGAPFDATSKAKKNSSLSRRNHPVTETEPTQQRTMGGKRTKDLQPLTIRVGGGATTKPSRSFKNLDPATFDSQTVKQGDSQKERHHIPHIIEPASAAVAISNEANDIVPDNKSKISHRECSENPQQKGSNHHFGHSTDESLLVSSNQQMFVPSYRPSCNLGETTVSMQASNSDNARSKPQKRTVNNENFVKLNLRNNAGACRGARNKKRKKYSSSRYNDDGQPSFYNSNKTAKDRKTNRNKSNSGIDPLDDFMDGVFHGASNSKARKSEGKTPICARHQRPCRLLTVKKNSTGNKGRKFYACSMPKGEQCDHFEWAENTKEAAQVALLKNSSHSGFVARQVAAYTERFSALTVPELREEARYRNLETAGRRQQLLTRLSIWVRDEMTTRNPERNGNGKLVDRSSDNKMAATDDLDGDEAGESSHESDPSLDLDFVSLDSLSETDDACDENSASDGFRIVEEEASSLDDSETTDEPMDGSVDDEEDCVPREKSSLHASLESIFGFSDFREGQEWAIRRCLDHKKTLLVAPTSFGKSLCYALPAVLMDGICIVVSPLVSLIQDQLHQLPPCIPATTLSGTMSTATMAAKIDDLIRNRLKLLFVSPERLASSSFRRLFRPRWNPDTATKQRPFPSISLLVLDEAHCISQYGHNFRPCYLRIRSFLDLAQPKSVLAITATAGPLVVGDICRALRITVNNGELENEADDLSSQGPDTVSSRHEDAVRIMNCNRDNIEVSCLVMACEEERRSELSKLLVPHSINEKDSRTNSKQVIGPGCLSHGSVIVYVWRQRDAEVVAEHLSASGVAGGVVVYHGGMDAASRSKAQLRFMRGRARICVATVAFGLGINKADIAAVVHLHLPSSPENYLQEIGRAGRDGRKAKAIALLVKEDVVVRHSLAHSDSISFTQITVFLDGLRKLGMDAIQEGFGFEALDPIQCEGRQLSIAIPIESSVRRLDCKFESIETVLSLLEARSSNRPFFHIEGTMLDTATITLKRRKLEKLALDEPIAQCILKCTSGVDRKTHTKDNISEGKKNFESEFQSYSFGVHRFSVTRCARFLGTTAEPRHVFAALRRLQDTGELELALESRSVHLRLTNAGMELFSRATSDETLQGLGKELCTQFENNVNCVAGKVLGIQGIMHEVATVDSPNDQPLNSRPSKSTRLALFQDLIQQFFDQAKKTDRPNNSMDKSELPKPFHDESRKELSFDIESLVRELSPSKNRDSTDSVHVGGSHCSDYTALALTKFFHAIDSPRTPSAAFSRHVLFGKWRETEFTSLLEAVKNVVKSNQESTSE